jgi:hypothetical protein
LSHRRHKFKRFRKGHGRHHHAVAFRDAKEKGMKDAELDAIVLKYAETEQTEIYERVVNSLTTEVVDKDESTTVTVNYEQLCNDKHWDIFDEDNIRGLAPLESPNPRASFFTDFRGQIDLFRKCPRHPLDEAVKNLRAPSTQIARQSQSWPPATFGFAERCVPRASTLFSPRCLFEGVPGAFPEFGLFGLRESMKKCPGDGDSHGVPTHLRRTMRRCERL